MHAHLFLDNRNGLRYSPNMMTNEMGRTILSLTPYIAACVRNASRKMGIRIGDLDTDDIVSSILEKALSTELRADGNIKAFLATCARNATLDFLHTGHAQSVYFGQSINVTDARQSESTDDDSTSVGYTALDGTIDAERTLLAAESLASLRIACESLTEAQRHVMTAWLDAGEDFDVDAYAASIGAKPSAVRVNISKARTALAA